MVTTILLQFPKFHKTTMLWFDTCCKRNKFIRRNRIFIEFIHRVLLHIRIVTSIQLHLLKFNKITILWIDICCKRNKFISLRIYNFVTLYHTSTMDNTWQFEKFMQRIYKICKSFLRVFARFSTLFLSMFLCTIKHINYHKYSSQKKCIFSFIFVNIPYYAREYIYYETKPQELRKVLLVQNKNTTKSELWLSWFIWFLYKKTKEFSFWYMEMRINILNLSELE